MKLSNNRFFEKISLDQFKTVFAEHYKDSEETLEQVYENFPLPQRATKKSAGYDIYAPFSFELSPGEEIKIPTGLRVIMQPDEVLMILPRSGQGFKHYLRLANTVGVIDADYCEADNEGHIWIKCRVESSGDNQLKVTAGQGIAQAIFTKYLLVDSDSYLVGEDRTGGFGSTTK